ncbi:MAG: potassium channel protein [Candidatus Solibacter usitatus]|nr:potassium channel protein [Candidatus Solibacter usitatus]
MLRRIKLISASLAVVFAIGTCGFVYLENYPWLDAFYMTLTTITTIGYGEIHPLSPRGRLFNVFLIIIGVGIMFQAVGLVAQIVLEREFGDLLGRRKSKRMIERLKDHFIICGYGRVGRGAAMEMQRAGVPFVVVDRKEDKVEMAMRMGMLAVVADCTRDETLRDLHIDRARGLVSALTSDADNMFLILSAKTLNAKLAVSARANEEEAEQKLRRAGADSVFAPYYLTGHRLAQSILKPHVQQFMDIFTRNMGLSASMEQVRVERGSEMEGKSLRDLQLRRDMGVIVLGIRRGSGTMEFNPPADAVVNGGDYLIVMGEAEALRKLENLLAGAAM